MNAILQLPAKDKDEDSVYATLLAALMEAWPESLAFVENGMVLLANRAFADIFGYPGGSDVQGRSLSELIRESESVFSDNREIDEWQPAAGNSEDGAARECSGTRKDGAPIRIEVACSRLRVARSELWVLSARGACERKPDDRQLQESQRLEAMGRLVGGVAHDFNNLLTGILLYSDLLVAGLGGNRALRGYAEEIRRAGGHSSALIQQLLGVARPQADDPEISSWDEVIAGTRNLLARLLGENIELVTLLATDAGKVRMGHAEMRQILFNLLLNARDAMPEGGRIILTAGQAAAGRVELTVTDAGCGMSPETRARLFENCFTTKPLGKGNGLGLSTVGRIVKKGNGTIEVESAPGRGTRVTVSLPGASQSAAERHPGQPDAASPVPGNEI